MRLLVPPAIAAILCLSGVAFSSTELTSELRLSDASFFSERSVPALAAPSGAVPCSMVTAIGDFPLRLSEEQASFALALEPELLAGGGDGGGSGLVALAFILGVIPGFGIGHLVAGSIGGFIVFLIIDVLISPFFFLFPYVFYAGTTVVWWVDGALLLVERIVEGSLAAAAASVGHVHTAEGDGIGLEAPSTSLLSLRF